jgi:chromosome segregation ATPase
MSSPQPNMDSMSSQLQALREQLQAISVQESNSASQLSETTASATILPDPIAVIEAGMGELQRSLNGLQKALDGIKTSLEPLNKDLERRTAGWITPPRRPGRKLTRHRAHIEGARRHNASANESQKLLRLRGPTNKPIFELPNTIANLYCMPGEHLLPTCGLIQVLTLGRART